MIVLSRLVRLAGQSGRSERESDMRFRASPGLSTQNNSSNLRPLSDS